MKVFFDTEFTGLHEDTTLISIGLVDENDRTFYAELTDYARGQVDDWIKDNVLANLSLSIGPGEYLRKTGTDNNVKCIGRRVEIAHELARWLSVYDRVEMWGDCLAFDWFLFCGLFGHAFNIPKNVHYIPLDICTLFWIGGLDPDLDREHYAGVSEDDEWVGPPGKKHNALWDARVIKACHKQYMESGGKDA